MYKCIHICCRVAATPKSVCGSQHHVKARRAVCLLHGLFSALVLIAARKWLQEPYPGSAIRIIGRSSYWTFRDRLRRLGAGGGVTNWCRNAIPPQFRDPPQAFAEVPHEPSPINPSKWAASNQFHSCASTPIDAAHCH